MFNVRFCVTGFLFLRARLSLRSTLGLEQKGLGGRVKLEERLDFQPHLRRVHPPSITLFGKVLNSPGCESWCWSSARCLQPPAKALSHSIMTGKGQNAASANCYFKGKGNRPPLTPTMVHILSQWGSLMCEQGSGRAVNRAFYQAARGELGCQWRGLSRVCHVPTLGPGLFVLMAARDWRDCGPCLHWIYVKQESPLSMRNPPVGLHQDPRSGPPGNTGLYWWGEDQLELLVTVSDAVYYT